MTILDYLESVQIALAKHFGITTSEAAEKAKPFKDLLLKAYSCGLSHLEASFLLEKTLGKEPCLTVNQIVYLKKVKTAMEKLHSSFRELNKLWAEDQEGDEPIELNAYLRALYPFEKSFDDLTLDVEEWKEDSFAKFRLEGIN